MRKYLTLLTVLMSLLSLPDKGYCNAKIIIPDSYVPSDPVKYAAMVRAYSTNPQGMMAQSFWSRSTMNGKSRQFILNNNAEVNNLYKTKEAELASGQPEYLWGNDKSVRNMQIGLKLAGSIASAYSKSLKLGGAADGVGSMVEMASNIIDFSEAIGLERFVGMSRTSWLEQSQEFIARAEHDSQTFAVKAARRDMYLLDEANRLGDTAKANLLKEGLKENIGLNMDEPATDTCLKLNLGACTDQTIQRILAEMPKGEANIKAYIQEHSDELKAYLGTELGKVQESIKEGFSDIKLQNKALSQQIDDAAKGLDGKVSTNQALLQKLVASDEERKAVEAERIKREIQQQIETAKAEDLNATLQMTSMLLGSIDPKLGKQFEVVSGSLIKMDQATKAFKALGPLKAGAEQLSGLGVATLTMNYVGAAMAIYSVFSDTNAPNADQIILEQLSKLSMQINELRIEMHERFDRLDQRFDAVDEKLDTIYTTMVRGFDAISKQQSLILQEQLKTQELVLSTQRLLLQETAALAKLIVDKEFMECVSSNRFENEGYFITADKFIDCDDFFRGTHQAQLVNQQLSPSKSGVILEQDIASSSARMTDALYTLFSQRNGTKRVSQKVADPNHWRQTSAAYAWFLTAKPSMTYNLLSKVSGQPSRRSLEYLANLGDRVADFRREVLYSFYPPEIVSLMKKYQNAQWKGGLGQWSVRNDNPATYIGAKYRVEVTTEALEYIIKRLPAALLVAAEQGDIQFTLVVKGATVYVEALGHWLAAVSSTIPDYSEPNYSYYGITLDKDQFEYEPIRIPSANISWQGIGWTAYDLLQKLTSDGISTYFAGLGMSTIDSVRYSLESDQYSPGPSQVVAPSTLFVSLVHKYVDPAIKQYWERLYAVLGRGVGELQVGYKYDRTQYVYDSRYDNSCKYRASYDAYNLSVGYKNKHEGIDLEILRLPLRVSDADAHARGYQYSLSYIWEENQVFCKKFVSTVEGGQSICGGNQDCLNEILADQMRGSLSGQTVMLFNMETLENKLVPIWNKYRQGAAKAVIEAINQQSVFNDKVHEENAYHRGLFKFAFGEILERSDLLQSIANGYVRLPYLSEMVPAQVPDATTCPNPNTWIGCDATRVFELPSAVYRESEALQDILQTALGENIPVALQNEGLRTDAQDLRNLANTLFDEHLVADCINIKVATPTYPNAATQGIPDFDKDGEGDPCDMDDDNDGLSDAWEREYGLNPFNPQDAWLDRNGDGLLNIAEYYDLDKNPAKLTRHVLTVTAGLGGTVISSPPGTSCDSVCTQDYPSTANVLLTANPAMGYVLAGWGGACQGTGACVVPMDANKSVTASFMGGPRQTLSVGRTGYGLVSSNVAGISCGADCTEDYPINTVVTLTPSSGTFQGWGGACSGTGVCRVTMSAARSVTAAFAPRTFTSLTVSKTGKGSIVSAPAGINCGTACVSTYTLANKTVVTLTAKADPGWEFAGWSGGSCTGTDTCTVTLDDDRWISARFILITTKYDLSVSKTGDGLVSSNLEGITCGSDCTESYTDNTQVRLEAYPDDGQVFTGWGGACSGTGTCEVIMSAARSVTATFKPYQTGMGFIGTEAPTALLTVTKAGNGTVISIPSGITCGADCTQRYFMDATVELTAMPQPGWEFTGWGGACSGKGECKVAMSVARNVTATFTQIVVKHTLTVSQTGNGTVTSSPAGINCGAACSFAFTSGTAVTLSATPANGFAFTGWNGACTGTAATCAVSMTSPKAVTATFVAVPTYLLNVNKAGNGTGTVTSVPAGITCGPACSASYASGTVVSLTATPTAGFSFSGWSGGCTGTATTCTTSMIAAKTVTATFVAVTPTNPVLTVTKTGSGTVTSSPAGINCGTACSAPFAKGASVKLTATPASGFKFANWSGGCTGTSTTCTTSMTASKSVVANFVAIANTNPVLTVTKTGSGTVTSAPAGINCGSSCSAAFAKGASVKLTATPASGFKFANWSGGCTGTAMTCTTSMTASKSVVANFVAVTPTNPVLTVTKTGSGTVTSAPAGINCGSSCSAAFAKGASVKLTATPASGFKFANWSGGCSGTATTCTTSMTASKSVTANFVAIANTNPVLTVTKTGTGTVTSSPTGINCGTACSAPFAKGASVKLTATPASGFKFANWSGGCTGTAMTCTTSMTASKSVRANFVR